MSRASLLLTIFLSVALGNSVAQDSELGLEATADGAVVTGGGSTDLASLLQHNLQGAKQAAARAAEGTSEPFLIGLRRESVPVYRRGKVASFKTSYSGTLAIGNPPQEFRVVFDTGSGHVVLPAAECKSEACLVHRRYNMTASSTSLPINTDGSEVPEGELCDQVTIGFGTGQITGEFAKDTVCFGSGVAEPSVEVDNEGNLPALPPMDTNNSLCVEMHVVVAVEMSTQPFKTFHFDGILGLGLDGLALSKQFSAFDMLMGSGKLGNSHFGVFLTEGEDGEESEIAFGGVNTKRTLEPLSWEPVAMADLGYWQVEIKAVRINGIELDVCKDGTCRGVVDTGTSHWGVPAPFDGEIQELLTRPAGDLLDCRLAEAPEVEIELMRGYNLTLHPFNYMRRLPLRADVSVGSVQGVYVPSEETNKTLPPSELAPPALSADQAAAVPEQAVVVDDAEAKRAAEAAAAAAAAVAVAPPVQQSAEGASEANDAEVQRFCRPRIMPVRLPAPLGPKLFILGEPVLHRYYTVYDWADKQVGFALANNRRNTMDPSEITDRRGVLPKEVDMLLMQQTVGVSQGVRRGGVATETTEMPEDAHAFVQVTVSMTFRRVRRGRDRV